MPRRAPEDISGALTAMLSFGEGTPSARSKLRMMQMMRSTSSDAAQAVDEALLQHLASSHERAENLIEEQNKLRAVVEKLTGAPWYPARLLKRIMALGRVRAHVQAPGGTRVVDFCDDVDPDTLDVGDLAYLNADQNLIMAKADADLGLSGETAFYERPMPDGRLVAKVRDEELILHPAATLAVGALEAGDQLRFDRTTWLALERVEREPRRTEKQRPS